MINGNPVAASGLVIVGTNHQSAVALNERTGEVIWRARLNDNSTSDVIRRGQYVYLSTWTSLYKLRISDGTIMEKWCRKGFKISNFLVLLDRQILHIREELPEDSDLKVKLRESIICLKDSTVLWEVDAPEYIYGLSYLDEERLISTSGSGLLYLLSPENGETNSVIRVEPKWSGYFSNPITWNGILYVQGFHGAVYACRLD